MGVFGGLRPPNTPIFFLTMAAPTEPYFGQELTLSGILDTIRRTGVISTGCSQSTQAGAGRWRRKTQSP
jgi:hypothetical protein